MIKCQECGKELSKAVKFCPYCGNVISSDEGPEEKITTDSTSSDVSKSKSKIPLIVGIGIGTALLIGIIAFVILGTGTSAESGSWKTIDCDNGVTIEVPDYDYTDAPLGAQRLGDGTLTSINRKESPDFDYEFRIIEGEDIDTIFNEFTEDDLLEMYHSFIEDFITTNGSSDEVTQTINDGAIRKNNIVGTTFEFSQTHSTSGGMGIVCLIDGKWYVISCDWPADNKEGKQQGQRVIESFSAQKDSQSLQGPSMSSGTSSLSEDSSNHTRPSADSSAENSRSSEEPATTEAQSSIPPAIDLADAQQYYDANLFLTNFAEYYCFSDGYTQSSYNLKELIEWGFWHKALNNDSLPEYGMYTVPGTTSGFGDDITQWGPNFSTRVPTADITESIQRYLGLSVDISRYDSDDNDTGKTYVEYDGYVYESAIRGEAVMADYVAICTGAETVDATTVQLNFNAYRCSNNPGVHSDAAWFGYTPQQVEDAGGYLEWQGLAVVKVDPAAEHPYTLVGIKQL